MMRSAWSLVFFVSTFTALGALGVACSSSSSTRDGFVTEEDASENGSFFDEAGTGIDAEAGSNKCLSEALAAEPVPLAMLLSWTGPAPWCLRQKTRSGTRPARR